MKAYIIGGGFAGLSAAGYLIKNAGISGNDIIIYEANELMGGGFFLEGTAQIGYNLPGSVFDKEFRCTFDLLSIVPSLENPNISVKDEFFKFNKEHPFQDKVHIIDKNGKIVLHESHFGLNLFHGVALSNLLLTPEFKLNGRQIKEFFSTEFFSTEFWLLFSTIMGALPQHSAIEFRRYIKRTLALFPDLFNMSHIMRTPHNQYQSFIEPLVAWLYKHGVNFSNKTFVKDIGFKYSSYNKSIDRLDYEKDGKFISAVIETDDIVLITTGSQVTDMSVGSMTEAPIPLNNGKSCELWKKIAYNNPVSIFGNPYLFFDHTRISETRWVSFTVTTKEIEFIKKLSLLTNSEPGSGGLVTLKDSSWLISLSIFHQPEIVGQPLDTNLWWGYGLYPERNGDFIKKSMNNCTGAEILEEVLKQLDFNQELDNIMKSSICIPCDMPYINNIWLPRHHIDRPPVVLHGADNFGFIGQYVEISDDIVFTIEYSARTAWEAVHTLLKRGPSPPLVYQGQFDLKALIATLEIII